MPKVLDQSYVQSSLSTITRHLDNDIWKTPYKWRFYRHRCQAFSFSQTSLVFTFSLMLIKQFFSSDINFLIELRWKIPYELGIKIISPRWASPLSRSSSPLMNSALNYIIKWGNTSSKSCISIQKFMLEGIHISI